VHVRRAASWSVGPSPVQPRIVMNPEDDDYPAGDQCSVVLITSGRAVHQPTRTEVATGSLLFFDRGEAWSLEVLEPLTFVEFFLAPGEDLPVLR
jgi:hypothetical protein